MGGIAVRSRATITAWRENGWRAAAKQGGWKLIAAVLAFYLIRDLTLYVLVPLGVIGLIR